MVGLSKGACVQPEKEYASVRHLSVSECLSRRSPNTSSARGPLSGLRSHDVLGSLYLRSMHPWDGDIGGQVRGSLAVLLKGLL